MMREMDFVDEYYADKDLSLLKKLTLVIPTYNRNYYLSRCLWYHAHFPFGEIIVADSSPEEKKVVNRKTVQKIREMFGANIRYLEYEPETEKYGGDIYRKWGDAVQHVETEYSQVSVDKEYLIPTSVQMGLEYLEEINDCIAVDGKYYFLRYSQKKRNYTLVERRENKHSEEEADALLRFQNAFIATPMWDNDLLPSIFRTQYHKKVYANLKNYQIEDIRYGELTLGYIGHLYGKYKYISDYISLIKDDSELFKQDKRDRKNSAESSSTRYPPLSTYQRNPSTKDFFMSYRRCIQGEIQKQTDLTTRDTEIFFETKITPELLLTSDLTIGLNSIYAKLTERLPVIADVWYRLPNPLKKYCGKCLTSITGVTPNITRGKVIPPSAFPETKIINRIVCETKHLHQADKPIFSELSYSQRS